MSKPASWLVHFVQFHSIEHNKIPIIQIFPNHLILIPFCFVFEQDTSEISEYQ